MHRLWLFLKRKRNRKVLAWVGGGVITVVGGLWVAYMQLRQSEERPPFDAGPGVETHGPCSPAVANTEGNVSISIGGASESDPACGD